MKRGGRLVATFLPYPDKPSETNCVATADIFVAGKLITTPGDRRVDHWLIRDERTTRLRDWKTVVASSEGARDVALWQLGNESGR